MISLCIALAFVAMVLAPCFAAMGKASSEE